jgi:hypothetical protein
MYLAILAKPDDMRTTLRILDWLVSVAERLLVLGMTVAIFRFGYQVVRGNSTVEQMSVLRFFADNWKIGIIVLVVLFYGTVRIFLEQVQEVWGMKRPLPLLTDPPEPIAPKK